MGMFNLGWIISDLISSISTILVVFVVVVLFIIALKYEGSRKFIYFSVCFVLIIGAGFALIDCYERFSAASSVNGKIEYSEITYDSVLSVEYNPLVLYEKDDGTYYFDDDLAFVKFDATKENYEILVNGRVTNNVELGAGYISSDFVLQIYDTTDKLVTTITLNIRFEFYTTRTYLLITSDLTAEDESYLRTYVSTNSFVVDVVYSISTPVVKDLN